MAVENRNALNSHSPPIIMPIYQAAIDANEASFPLLLKLRRDLKKVQAEHAERSGDKGWQCLQENECWRSLIWYYRRAHSIFRNAYGSFTEMHTCDDGSAVALTNRQRFFSNYCIKDDSDIDRLLLECDQMAMEADRLLWGKELQACTQILYATAKTLLCLKNIPQADKDVGEDQPPCLKLIKRHLAYAREYHKRAAERLYFLGMFGSIVIFVIVLVLLGILLRVVVMPDEVQITHVIASLLGGGIGAVISVTWRMIKGNLTVRCEVGKGTLMLIGLCRPLVGAVFGLLVYALIESELLPIAESANPLYFYSVIGFLAGFSERWAPDLLHTTENGLSTAAAPPSPTNSQQTDAFPQKQAGDAPVERTSVANGAPATA